MNHYWLEVLQTSVTFSIDVDRKSCFRKNSPLVGGLANWALCSLWVQFLGLDPVIPAPRQCNLSMYNATKVWNTEWMVLRFSRVDVISIF